MTARILTLTALVLAAAAGPASAQTPNAPQPAQTPRS